MKRGASAYWLGGSFLGVLALSAGGCMSPGERARLTKDNQGLQTENQALERELGRHEDTIARLHQQVRDLQGFGPNRPAAAFAPVLTEIASLSGGADYNGRPGDDGVTVYLRLLDADGDAVKAPGQIVVQLLDNSNLAAPQVLGLYRFDRVEQLREAWYGRFGTRHYALRCPFPQDVAVPRRVGVHVEFLDYLTGRTLTASQEVKVDSAPGKGG